MKHSAQKLTPVNTEEVSLSAFLDHGHLVQSVSVLTQKDAATSALLTNLTRSPGQISRDVRLNIARRGQAGELLSVVTFVQCK